MHIQNLVSTHHDHQLRVVASTYRAPGQFLLHKSQTVIKKHLQFHDWLYEEGILHRIRRSLSTTAFLSRSHTLVWIKSPKPHEQHADKQLLLHATPATEVQRWPSDGRKS